LDAHRVVVTNGDREVLRSPVGVGRADRPTPGGDYFTTELLRPPDPDGLYGPYAYGLSGYSDVLMDFRGGEGVIGIHGTNEPELVGTDVSSGCIRLPNEQIIRMVEQIGLPLGTPVTIR
jgi:lipoprotein-anchoring transpeptidase ErfK/SrfK